MNKSNIIDYIILLNLFFRKKNIYFDKIFYIEFSNYLIPQIKINDSYYEYLKINDFITKYNIKNKLLYLSNIFKSINSIKIYIYFDKIDQNKMVNIQIKLIQKIIFNFEKNIFEFNLPLNLLQTFKNIKFTYNYFNEIMTNIWEDNYGLLMSKYIFSSAIDKIIYYELFKKIIKRINNQSHHY
jgi:hypothetical protein